MSRDRPTNPKEFFADLRRVREKIAEHHDNETWRREALIRPVLKSPFGLGFQEHEILCEVSFPIHAGQARLLAEEIYPNRKRIRADYLILPEGNIRPSGLVEAKGQLPDFVSVQSHKNQALIGQVLADTDWGLLTDGEAWLLMRGDEELLYCDSIENLEAAIAEFRSLVGPLIRRFGGSPRIRLMPVIQHSQTAPQVPESVLGGQLSEASVREIGPRSAAYNSVAWAAGETDRFWWPDESSFYYWPHGVERKDNVTCCVEAFKQLGYESSPYDALEPGFTRVSIFGHSSIVHVARQISNGLWTSKIGVRGPLVEHGLSAVHGSYGRPTVFMRRPVSAVRH